MNVRVTLDGRDLGAWSPRVVCLDEPRFRPAFGSGLAPYIAAIDAEVQRLLAQTLVPPTERNTTTMPETQKREVYISAYPGDGFDKMNGGDAVDAPSDVEAIRKSWGELVPGESAIVVYDGVARIYATPPRPEVVEVSSEAITKVASA